MRWSSSTPLWVSHWLNLFFFERQNNLLTFSKQPFSLHGSWCHVYDNDLLSTLTRVIPKLPLKSRSQRDPLVSSSSITLKQCSSWWAYYKSLLYFTHWTSLAPSWILNWSQSFSFQLHKQLIISLQEYFFRSVRTSHTVRCPPSNLIGNREISDIDCHQPRLLHLKHFLPPFPVLFETPRKLHGYFYLEPVASWSQRQLT